MPTIGFLPTKTPKKLLKSYKSLSKQFQIHSGEPQGSIHLKGLCYTLFFIYDIGKDLKYQQLLNVNYLKISILINSEDFLRLLQVSILLILKWSNENCLPINYAMSRVYTFSRKT